MADVVFKMMSFQELKTTEVIGTRGKLTIILLNEHIN